MTYTSYKIDVQCNGESWSVYRRFSEFLKLHKQLVAVMGEEFFKTAEIVPPEKTVGSNFKSVVVKRQDELQTYLFKILSIDEIDKQTSVTKFLDFESKGLSGAAKDLGQNQILLETLASVKPCKDVMELWQSSYVVLTKSGTIFVLRNLYDSVSSPLVSFSLVNGDVTVTTPTGSPKVDMTCKAAGTRLVLRLSTEMQLASWLRTIADFTTRAKNTVYDKPPANRPSQSPSPSQRPSAASQGGNSYNPSDSIHAKGSGATTDELSAMYGV